MYAAAVVPGSPAAKEGSLAVGDRIVAVSLQNRANCPLNIDIAPCDHQKKQKPKKLSPKDTAAMGTVDRKNSLGWRSDSFLLLPHTDSSGVSLTHPSVCECL